MCTRRMPVHICVNISIPATRDHLPRGDTLAANRQCPLVAGTTVLWFLLKIYGFCLVWQLFCFKRLDRYAPKWEPNKRGWVVEWKVIRFPHFSESLFWLCFSPLYIKRANFLSIVSSNCVFRDLNPIFGKNSSDHQTLSLRFVWSRVCAFLYSLGPRSFILLLSTMWRLIAMHARLFIGGGGM